MLGFKSFMAEGIADANSFMTHDSKMRGSGYKRVGSMANASGNTVHVYRIGKGKKTHSVHLHVQSGVVTKVEPQQQQQQTSKLNEELPVTKHFHKIHGNYCGPGNRGGEPVDSLDAACKNHDIGYHHTQNSKHKRVKHDSALIDAAHKVAHDSSEKLGTRLKAHAVKSFFKIKSAIGSSTVKEEYVLMNESAPSRHEPATDWNHADAKKALKDIHFQRPHNIEDATERLKKHGFKHEISKKYNKGTTAVHTFAGKGGHKIHVETNGSGQKIKQYHRTEPNHDGYEGDDKRPVHENNDKPKELGHGHWPADYPATHTHKGVMYWKTGKVGTHTATGNPSAEYSWRSSGLTNPSHPHGSQEHRVWRDFKSGKSLKEDQDKEEYALMNKSGPESPWTEDISEAVLDIKHAINHMDPQARHHARKYKEAVKSMDRLIKPYYVGGATDKMAYDSADHYETARHHATKYKKRLAQLDAGLKKEETETPPHARGTKVVVSHKGHQKSGRVIRHDPGGPDSSPFYVVDVGEYGSHKFMAHHVRKEDLDEGRFASVPKMAKHYAKQKWMAAFNDHVTSKHPEHSGKIDWDTATHLHNRGKTPEEAAYTYHRINTKIDEGLDEGLVSRITNAAKNLNKKQKSAGTRVKETRKKVEYDGAKGTDLRPRGKALRAVEKIEWSKKNPVTRPRPLVPMPKLPEKIWTKEELEPKGGQKLLKELPKRGPDGKIIKSKTAQKVEDCIKMSGKQEKIDTEPTLNNLTTPGMAGQ